jgi:hypothetical protein
MAFALAVEMVNMRMRRAHNKPVKLHSPYEEKPSGEPPAAA